MCSSLWLVRPWPPVLIVGLGFLARDWAGSQQWRQQTLATRPVVSDKGLWPFGFAEKNLYKLKSREASKVSIRREKSIIRVDRHMGRCRESLSCAVMQLCSLNYFYGVLLSRFPLANHFDLPGLQSIFGISQDPPICVHASFSREGFTGKAYG